MMPFEQFPYTNFHELNLDWLIKEVKDVAANIDSTAENAAIAEAAAEEAKQYAEQIELLNLNVKTPQLYGAVGDGITDDYNAFVSALNAMVDGGILFIPNGTYVLSDTLRIPSNITILGETQENSILKASSDFDQTHATAVLTSLICNKNLQMNDPDGDCNINIINITIDNNNQVKAGYQGILQLRGVHDSNFIKLKIIGSGNGVNGFIMFSNNHNINVRSSSVVINTVGYPGCALWIRSGLLNGTPSYNINIEDSHFKSSSTDEVVCIADGLAGCETKATMRNCLVEGNATTSLPNFLLTAYALDNTSNVEALFDNIHVVGPCNNYGVALGTHNNSANALKAVLINSLVDVTTGGGVTGSDRIQNVINSIIRCETTKYSCYYVRVDKCDVTSKVFNSEIENSTIDVTGVACEQCTVVKNNIIKATTIGVQYNNSYSAIVENNQIYANQYGIRSSESGTNVLNDSLIVGNKIQRLDNNNNAGSIGVLLSNSTTTVYSSNLVYGSAGNTAKESYGFNYAYTIGSGVTQTGNVVSYK